MQRDAGLEIDPIHAELMLRPASRCTSVASNSEPDLTPLHLSPRSHLLCPLLQLRVHARQVLLQRSTIGRLAILRLPQPGQSGLKVLLLMSQPHLILLRLTSQT